MRVLLAEDDLASRLVMQKYLSRYGECDIAVDGLEALDAFLKAMKDKQLYDLVCLDIMMPKLDGIKALKAIRAIERQKGIKQDERVKIIMITALNDEKTVMEAYELGCEGYAWKPVDLKKLEQVLLHLDLIE